MAIDSTDTTTKKSFWDTVKQDFEERFMNFETAKGVYMVPAGLVTIYITWFHLQFVIQAVCSLFGLYIFSEGWRKVLVNRVKQRFTADALAARRLETLGGPTAPATTIPTSLNAADIGSRALDQATSSEPSTTVAEKAVTIEQSITPVEPSPSPSPSPAPVSQGELPV